MLDLESICGILQQHAHRDWNINHIGQRLPILLTWLAAMRSDAVAFQELKCTEAALPREALASVGYGSLVQGTRANQRLLGAAVQSSFGAVLSGALAGAITGTVAGPGLGPVRAIIGAAVGAIVGGWSAR